MRPAISWLLSGKTPFQPRQYLLAEAAIISFRTGFQPAMQSNGNIPDNYCFHFGTL